jgi:hypothetical protein
MKIKFGFNHFEELKNYLFSSFFFYNYIPPYTLAGFDLATQSSSLHGGRRRWYHAARADLAFVVFLKILLRNDVTSAPSHCFQQRPGLPDGIFSYQKSQFG